MTPQSNFMVIAPLVSDKTSALRTLLASMNRQPGVVDPQNSLVAFGEFDRLHFARFIVFDDQTLNDIAVYGLPRPNLPTYLAFLGDCDGPADEFLAELTQRAGSGLRQIFSHCEGFAANGDLLRWMQDNQQRAAAAYVNWIGRTVRQVREENALRNALTAYLDGNRTAIAAENPVQIQDDLTRFVNGQVEAGRLTLTPPATTPLGWKVRNFFHLVGVPVVLLLLAPLLLLYLPIFLVQLRCRERSDPEICPPPDPEHVKKLADLEDHDVTNQFSALGSVKPGLFRRWTVSFLVWILDYGSRHIFNRGFLTRVNSIHFARWVFLDNKKRLFFASNYDGSLESYMDDFINKVAWGLNLVFSNGVGYPRSNWLVLNGAKDEQKFKHFIRRHELPTEVWYNAHPGLTAVDLERNRKIRQGIEKPFTTEAEIQEWLRLF